MQSVRRVTLILILLALLAGCAPQPAPTPIRIGSKDFTEAVLLGEMYAQLLEANGLPVERRLELGETQTVHNALTSGSIDLYPEYTGTSYVFILGISEDEQDPARVYQRVAAEYKQKWNLIWLQPAPMNDTNAIACTMEAAASHGLKTLSDLSAQAPNVRLAAVPDFPDRPDGLAGLRKLYGGFEFREMALYDPGQQYRAITEGKADCVVAFSTDGQVAAYHLVLMQDDKGLWPPYNPAPVVRDEVLQRHPQIEEILGRLAPLVTDESMSALNWKVDGGKQDYTTVAREFLRTEGLVK